jgi:TolB-like protein/DNA-binding winged helix-turn-helix (wHTH) protein
MELLLLLVEQRGRLVSREEIIEKIWGKDVFLDADSSVNSAVRKIRRALKDNAERPRFVQTVTGRGYRFIAPIINTGPPPLEAPAQAEATPAGPAEREERAPTENFSAARVGSVEQRPAPNTAMRLKKLWVGGLLAAGLSLLLGLALWGRSHLFTTAPTAPIRSVAILPLENLTGDQGQQYFVDGMTDALTTTLAEIGSLQVISRTSAMRYRDSGKQLPEIAKELGVDAVVEGSVARYGDRVHVRQDKLGAPASSRAGLMRRPFDRSELAPQPCPRGRGRTECHRLSWRTW